MLTKGTECAKVQGQGEAWCFQEMERGLVRLEQSE